MHVFLEGEKIGSNGEEIFRFSMYNYCSANSVCAKTNILKCLVGFCNLSLGRYGTLLTGINLW